MATGGVTNYSCCSPCLDDGRNTVARHYCVDCEMYFCTKCVKCHIKIPALKAHQVNDVDSGSTDLESMSLQSDVPSVSEYRLRCALHRDKLIDTFCNDHNEVCCGSCAVVKHRLCTTVSIAVAAKDFNTSPEINTCKHVLADAIVMFTGEKEKRIENLDKIGKQKQELIKTVDKYEEDIIAKIKELANISRNEIRSRYEEHKLALDTDIGALDVMITTNTDYRKQLDQLDNERLFIHIKTNKILIKDTEVTLQALVAVCCELEIKFYFDELLDNQILQMKAFGVLEKHCYAQEYRAIFHESSNIIQSGDQATGSYVYDVCLTDSGDLLVTDDDNMKLKRFDSELQFKDAIKLLGKPYAVCKIDDKEVAVRIRSTKVVQFVSVGQSMQLASSFKLDDDGYGMTYDASTGEIFACEEKKVNVYSKTGNKLRTYDKDTSGEQIFSACKQIALSENKQDLYVTDKNKGLIILDKSGTLKIKVSLSDTWPLCLLPGDICLTGYRVSGVIVHIDKDGKQIGNLIDTKDGRGSTYCVVYDRKHSRLIVGGSGCQISVYTLCAK